MKVRRPADRRRRRRRRRGRRGLAAARLAASASQASSLSAQIATEQAALASAAGVARRRAHRGRRLRAATSSALAAGHRQRFRVSVDEPSADHDDHASSPARAVDVHELDVGGSGRGSAGPDRARADVHVQRDLRRAPELHRALDRLVATDGTNLAANGRLFTIAGVTLRARRRRAQQLEGDGDRRTLPADAPAPSVGASRRHRRASARRGGDAMKLATHAARGPARAPDPAGRRAARAARDRDPDRRVDDAQQGDVPPSRRRRAGRRRPLPKGLPTPAAELACSNRDGDVSRSTARHRANPFRENGTGRRRLRRRRARRRRSTTPAAVDDARRRRPRRRRTPTHTHDADAHDDADAHHDADPHDDDADAHDDAADAHDARHRRTRRRRRRRRRRTQTHTTTTSTQHDDDARRARRRPRRRRRPSVRPSLKSTQAYTVTLDTSDAQGTHVLTNVVAPRAAAGRESPEIIFLGVLKGGKKAVFLFTNTVAGQRRRRASARHCLPSAATARSSSSRRARGCGSRRRSNSALIATFTFTVGSIGAAELPERGGGDGRARRDLERRPGAAAAVGLDRAPRVPLRRPDRRARLPGARRDRLDRRERLDRRRPRARAAQRRDRRHLGGRHDRRHRRDRLRGGVPRSRTRPRSRHRRAGAPRAVDSSGRWRCCG